MIVTIRCGFLAGGLGRRCSTIRVVGVKSKVFSKPYLLSPELHALQCVVNEGRNPKP